MHTFATSRLLQGRSAPHVAATNNYTISLRGLLSYLLPFPLKFYFIPYSSLWKYWIALTINILVKYLKKFEEKKIQETDEMFSKFAWCETPWPQTVYLSTDNPFSSSIAPSSFLFPHPLLTLYADPDSQPSAQTHTHAMASPQGHRGRAGRMEMNSAMLQVATRICICN